MSKSKIFLVVSLIFLSSNFVWLKFFDISQNNPDFVYDEFYSFKALIKNTDKKLNGWQIIIQPQDLANFSGNILLTTPLYPEYKISNIIEVACKINQPGILVDDDGSEFDYSKYLSKSNIYATCYRPRIKVIDQQQDVAFYLGSSKQYFFDNLDNNLVEPASSLSKAILLASRREIPQDLRNKFSQVGLSHVIAISGLHMAIIVWLLQSLLIGLGIRRQTSFIYLFLFLLIYLYLIGFVPSAMRASLMVMMVLLGPILRRQTMSVYSLILAADIFVLFNPELLVYDIGFQLSFLAVLGLLWYVRFFNKILIFIPKKFKLREVLSVTLAAQILTWPLIVYYFKIFSVIAPVANFLVLPLLPAILLFSLLLALVGFVPILASIVSWPLFILFKIMIIITQNLVKIPGAYITINNFSVEYLIISFVFIFLLTFIIKPYNYE
jgi:competence protein ComEC